MSVAFSAEPVPLTQEDNGDIRVGDSRVLLDLVVHAFDGGATPETIVQMYPTLRLPDVYAVITYYLRHRDDVRRYLTAREQRGEQTRTMIESQQLDIREIRQRLLERRAEFGGAKMLRLLSDENFNGEIIRGLVRAQPDLSLLRVQDVGLLGADCIYE